MISTYEIGKSTDEEGNLIDEILIGFEKKEDKYYKIKIHRKVENNTTHRHDIISKRIINYDKIFI